MTISRSLLLTIMLGSTACRREQATPAPTAPPPTTLAAGDVLTVRAGTIETGPQIAGTLEAASTANLKAQLGGTVRAVGPELGETVRRGTVLVRVDPRSLGEATASAHAQLTSAQSQLDVARREVERTRALVAAGAIARRDLEQAESRATAQQAAVDQARAQVASASTALADATVRAPMDGVVAQRAVGVGDVVAPGTLLYQIIDPSTMRLAASVPSDQVGLVRIGAPARFTVRGYPDQTFTGTVTRIAPAADPATKQIAILVDMPNPGKQLLAGLFAQGRIAAERATGLVIPTSALDSSTGTPTVMRIRNGVVQRVPVKLGLRDPMRDVVQVASGLDTGDVIAARAAAAPPANTPVRVATR